MWINRCTSQASKIEQSYQHFTGLVRILIQFLCLCQAGLAGGGTMFWRCPLFIHASVSLSVSYQTCEHLRYTNRCPGLLILQYNIAILSIANTVFSIAKVLQYFLKICIGIGIANTFSSIGKHNFYQYQYQYRFAVGLLMILTTHVSVLATPSGVVKCHQVLLLIMRLQVNPRLLISLLDYVC